MFAYWSVIYMLIIGHPTISSKAVLVSPQAHHGITFPCQDPGINDTPLSLRSTGECVLLPRKSTVILWLVAKSYVLVCGWYGFVEINGSCFPDIKKACLTVKQREMCNCVVESVGRLMAHHKLYCFKMWSRFLSTKIFRIWHSIILCCYAITNVGF